jgi:hypothetical protein
VCVNWNRKYPGGHARRGDKCRVVDHSRRDIYSETFIHTGRFLLRNCSTSQPRRKRAKRQQQGYLYSLLFVRAFFFFWCPSSSDFPQLLFPGHVRVYLKTFRLAGFFPPKALNTPTYRPCSLSAGTSCLIDSYVWYTQI